MVDLKGSAVVGGEVHDMLERDDKVTARLEAEEVEEIPVRAS